MFTRGMNIKRPIIHLIRQHPYFEQQAFEVSVEEKHFIKVHPVFHTAIKSGKVFFKEL